MNAPSPLNWMDSPPWQALRAEPHAHDLFQVLRWLDARAGLAVPLGRAARPQGEPLRLGQRPSLLFAPSMIAGLEEAVERPPHLSIFGFGLFGPNGPLPLHLTEYAHDREHTAGDPTLAAFADLFHHRLILRFYRAWADAQATVSLDRPDASRFEDYIACLLGRGLPAQQDSAPLGRHAVYHQAGHLLRQTRNPEGLQRILSGYFGIPVRVVEYVAHWVTLEPDARLALGRRGESMGLGAGATLGCAVRDAQSRFRLVLGPMGWADYRRFLPDGDRVPALLRWVREYVGLELAWDAQLILAAGEVRGAVLSAEQPLGQGTWLGHRPMAAGDAGDLIIDYTHYARTGLRESHV